MKGSKALLVAAGAGTEGPGVRVKEGNWMVRLVEGVTVRVDSLFKTIEEPLYKKDETTKESLVLLVGPARVRAVVSPEYSGPPIHLDVELVNA